MKLLYYWTNYRSRFAQRQEEKKRSELESKKR